MIAVGGGRSKAWAILSVLSAGNCHVCITDEGAARKVMKLKDTIQSKGGVSHDDQLELTVLVELAGWYSAVQFKIQIWRLSLLTT